MGVVEAEAAERHGEWCTAERGPTSGVAGAPGEVCPFGADTPQIRRSRTSAGGLANLPQAWCIGMNSSTRDGEWWKRGRAWLWGWEGATSREITAYPASRLFGNYIRKKNKQQQEKRNEKKKETLLKKSFRPLEYLNLIPALGCDFFSRYRDMQIHK